MFRRGKSTLKLAELMTPEGTTVAAAVTDPSTKVGTTPEDTSVASSSPKKKTTFHVQDFKLSATLGTGTFGRVRLVKHEHTSEFYALKILKKNEIMRLKQFEHIKNEVQILAEIQHPYLVNLQGHFQDEKRLYMVLEYVQGGELFTYLRNQGRLGNESAKFYVAQLVLAFGYLHSLHIIYRDLKPENILITPTGYLKVGLRWVHVCIVHLYLHLYVHVLPLYSLLLTYLLTYLSPIDAQVTDFGFAKKIEDRTFTLCGTPEYLAPEIIQSKGHNASVDWWALGILLYEMLAGYPPFYDENPFGIYQKILQGKIEYPRHFDSKAKDLIKKLLVADRSKRLGGCASLV